MHKRSLALVLFAVSPFLRAQADVKILSRLNHEATVLTFNRMSIPEVLTQIRTELALILPEGETVISATCGDAGGELNGWVLVWSPQSNVVTVKPAKQGALSNLTIVSNHGNTYSFILREVSLTPGAQAELK